MKLLCGAHTNYHCHLLHKLHHHVQNNVSFKLECNKSTQTSSHLRSKAVVSGPTCGQFKTLNPRGFKPRLHLCDITV